jgi:2-dehydro-3-deoxyglucarate aldolase
MDRLKKIIQIRKDLKNELVSLGSWIQIPNSSVAEIIGQAGYDWVAVDLEHGSIGIHQLPDLFRSLELGDTLPLVRLAEGSEKACKQALDAGAGGVIVPMIESAEQLEKIRKYCCWPPSGKRGVGFSRANLYGKHFNDYSEEAQSPFLVAMIESLHAVDNLQDILQVDGLDAILIGPYDLSASMGLTGKFSNLNFNNVLNKIVSLSLSANIPYGIHIIEPSTENLKIRINEGYRFIAYSLDSVFLNKSVVRPSL